MDPGFATRSARELLIRSVLPSLLLTVRRVHFILYVRDPEVSRRFYATVLAASPSLDVEGMTEFAISDAAVLGLMPEAGVLRLLEGRVDPRRGRGGPRAELYLMVDDVEAHHGRALEAGAAELDPPTERAWGHLASYVLDPDGHVVAFAAPLP